MINIATLVVTVLINVVPIFGIVFLKWDVGQVVLTYWFETMLLFLFGFAKIVKAQGVFVAKKNLESELTQVEKRKIYKANILASQGKPLIITIALLIFGFVAILSTSAVVIFFKPLDYIASSVGTMFILLVLEYLFKYIVNFYLDKGYQVTSPLLEFIDIVRRGSRMWAFVGFGIAFIFLIHMQQETTQYVLSGAIALRILIDTIKEKRSMSTFNKYIDIQKNI